MALRAIFADFAALGNEDGSFIDESLIDVLLGALASTQVSSLLDLSLPLTTMEISFEPKLGSSWLAMIVVKLSFCSFRVSCT